MPRKNNVAGVPGKDPTLPKVPLTIDGITRHLVYDFNAIAVTEELTGINLLECIDLQNLTAAKYRALLYSTLLKENPDITLEQVGALVRFDTLPAVTVALVEAWTGSRPEVVTGSKAENENPPVEQTNQD